MLKGLANRIAFPSLRFNSKSFIIKHQHQHQFLYSTDGSRATKITTGLTGLAVSPQARLNLINLYGELEGKLRGLPESYAYRNGMQAILENRSKLLKNEAYSDLDVELEIGEGQLEELVEQAQEELELVDKISKEWRPWESKQQQQQ